MTWKLELNDDAVSMLDAMKQKIKMLEQANKLYEAALKSVCPEGAKGEAFWYWNEARRITGRSYFGEQK